MGYDLVGAGGDFRWNGLGWGMVLDLALRYGWEPAGTLAPQFPLPDGNVESYDEWGGGYCSNDDQHVTHDDALALAAALERALPDIPDHDCWRDNGTLLEAMSGPNKSYLKAFISFCQAGGFSID